MIIRPGVLYRKRAPAENVEQILHERLRYLGWPTKKMRVRAHVSLTRPAGEQLVYCCKIGPYRNLDPAHVNAALKLLPRQCGHRRILQVLGHLKPQVLPGAQVSTVPAIGVIDRLQESSAKQRSEPAPALL